MLWNGDQSPRVKKERKPQRRKAYVERKVGRCFQWKAHGQCSKGDSCRISHDIQDSGNRVQGQRRTGRSSSPAPNSKAKTGEGGENAPKYRAIEKKALQTKRSEIPCRCKNCTKKRHVNYGILPCVKTTSLKQDANMEEHVSSDMLRLRRIPARSQRKVV